MCKHCILLWMLVLFSIGAGLVAAEDWGDWDDWDDQEETASAATASWHDTDAGLELSGYMESTGTVTLPRSWGEDPASGLHSLMRLRGRFTAGRDFSAVVEADITDSRGSASPSARMQLVGIAPADGEEQPLSAGMRPQIELDYLYGSLRLGAADVRVGRQPIAWGSAYAFNPTDLMNPVSLAGLAGVEPSGLTAVHTSLSPGMAWGVEGYLAFEDRSREAAPHQLMTPDALPFGMRFRLYHGIWDYSLGLVRAVDLLPGAADLDRRYLVTAEFAGSVGALLVYGEAALEPEDWQLPEALDAAIGVQYDLTEEVLVQLEYHRRGQGAASTADYPVAPRLRGGLVGRDYLVGVARSTLFRGDLTITAAGLINLHDGSVAVLPEIEYLLSDDVTVHLGAATMFGSRDSEFRGRFEVPGSGKVDIGRSQLFAGITWHF